MSVRHFFYFKLILFRYTDNPRYFCLRLKLIAMGGKIRIVLLALAIMSCTKERTSIDSALDYEYGRGITHEKIVLGNRLENPYKTENITKAIAALYPTKAGRVEVEPTDLYVRFLPKDEDQCRNLKEMGVQMLDHPLDYDILVEGDWYHDPEIPEGDLTWQYAVVPSDFNFPDIQYQIIHKCFIAENDMTTKADGIDWEAVERQAYIMTGNEDRWIDSPSTKAAKIAPSGRITIVDDKVNGGKAFGVAGVRVSCNSFVKFAHTYTDRDGYYQMPAEFSSNLRYRLVFENEKGFSIGFNLVLVPASVSTLGKAGPEGVNMTVTPSSEEKLFRRCVVNNAAYDYFTRCSVDDMGITAPPKDLRIWLFHAMRASSAVMIHHGTVLSSNLLEKYLGDYSQLIKYFMPDITIGVKQLDTYSAIYSDVCHELAHASHFAKVGTDYWNHYIKYIVKSYVESGGITYGDGVSEGAGYCEVGECWAYYLESIMYKERYGGSVPSFGSDYWFYPQILRYLDERGLTRSDIFSVLSASVISKEDLRVALIASFPEKRTIIEQVFTRYVN